MHRYEYFKGRPSRGPLEQMSEDPRRRPDGEGAWDGWPLAGRGCGAATAALLIDRLRRGQRSREMTDNKVRIFMKSSQHSFNNLLRTHLSSPRPQHLFKFDFARIEILRRHDEPDPEVMQNDDEMRQQPSHDPPDNREQGQGGAD